MNRATGMNAEEKIKHQVADDLAAGEEAVRKSRVRLAGFKIALGVLLSLLGTAIYLFSVSPTKTPPMCFLFFGGLALIIRALYDLKKHRQHTPSAVADTPLF